MKRSFLIGSLAVLVCLLLFPGTGWGQTGASTIRGSVKDQSGALVSGATVTLTNLETNAVRTAETTTSGAFAVRTAFVSRLDRKSTRLNSSHLGISYAVFCLKKK